MKIVALGLALAALLLAAFPRVAAAQCEGGTTVAGYYLRDGAYVPGHCAHTNPTTPGQMFPSGAQPASSTNPSLGLTRLPGQVYPGGLLPTTGSDAGLSTGQLAPASGPFVTSPGPGASAIPGLAGGAALPPNTSTEIGPGNILSQQANPSGLPAGGALSTAGLAPGGALAVRPTAATGVVPTTTSAAIEGAGLVSGQLSSAGIGPVGSGGARTSTGALSGLPSAASGALPAGSLVDPVVASVLAANRRTAGSLPLGRTADPTGAYGFSLPAVAPPPEVLDESAPSGPPLPPAPGRGGPTYIGEERAGDISIAVPGR